MPTIREIAEQAGVSIAAASIALHGKPGRKRVSDTRAAAIREIAKNLGYRPHAAARAMRSKRTRLVGVLLRNAPDRPFHNLANFEIVLGIADFLADHDYDVTIIPFRRLGADYTKEPKFLRERMLDGMIMLDSYTDELYAKIGGLIPSVVFVEANLWQPSGCIRRDESLAGRLAIKTLLDHGYRRIVWASHPHKPDDHYSSHERYLAVKEECVKSGIDLVEWRQNLKGYKGDKELVKLVHTGTGIVAYSDVYAKRVMSFLALAGLTTPQDYGLVSCDDSEETVSSFPDLTRVRFDRFGLGVRAGEMVLSMIRTPSAPPESVKWEDEILSGGTVRTV